MALEETRFDKYASLDTIPRQTHHKDKELQVATGSLPTSTHISKSPSFRCQDISDDPLERYRLHTAIHDSIFGKVFAAVDRKTGRNVAIKLSNLELLKSGRSIHGRCVLESPIHESAVMRRLCHMHSDTLRSSNRKVTSHFEDKKPIPFPAPPHVHQNILPLLNEFSDGRVHWMIMPLMQGELFDQVSRTFRPSARYLEAHQRTGTNSPQFDYTHTQRKFQGYFREMVEGLSYIHSHNLCHLDFSLENILIDFDGCLKICDFGVAIELPPERTLLPGFKDNLPGKLHYMAPEVFAGQPFNGKRADSFGLGVTLFCMLTARHPFEIPSASDPAFSLIAQGRLADLLRTLKVDHLVTLQAFEVMHGLLCPEWTRRWTLKQVRSHSYFTDALITCNLN